MAKTRVVVLGAGFGGLELTTILSEALGDGAGPHADRQERRLRLRLLEARRDVRPADPGRGPLALPPHREARRALSPGDDHRDRPGGAARHHRRRHLRRRRAGRRPRRRLRRGRDAGARRGRPRVLLRRRRRRACATCCPRSRRAAPSSACTSAPFKCPPAPSEAALLLARLSHDARRARGMRDQPRHAVRRAGPPRRTPLGRLSRRSPSATSRASRTGSCARSTRGAASPSWTMAPRCRTTCSSASRSTACRTWWRRAA